LGSSALFDILTPLVERVFMQPQNWFNLVIQLCYGTSLSPFKLLVIMTISGLG